MIYHALVEIIDKNEPAALCTIVRTQGSTPRHTTSKMVVYPDGYILGSVGGGELEHRVIGEAQQAIRDGRPRLLEYSMTDPHGVTRVFVAIRWRYLWNLSYPSRASP